jgi:hypothetical protein
MRIQAEIGRTMQISFLVSAITLTWEITHQHDFQSTFLNEN